jgi:hypothetical protein
MKGKCACTLVGAALAIISVTASTAAAAPPAGTPDVSAMVVAASDFPGATVEESKSGSPTGAVVGEFEQALTFAKPFGQSRYLLYYDTALLIDSASTAQLSYLVVKREFSSAKGRAALVKQFGNGLGGKAGKNLKASDLKTRAVALGDAGFETSFVVPTTGGKVDLSVLVLRLDRVIEIGVALGLGATPHPADSLALGRAIVTHVSAALVPIVASPPLVTGTSQQGQTLTASTGTWGDTPTSYAYQWQRCDGAGANCVDIAGATASTYAVGSGDVGATLRVNVTATNRFGSAAAPSAVTAAVT